MSSKCCPTNEFDLDSKYRSILLIVLLINLIMFVAEIIFSQVSGSQSLLADSLDFLSDTANYAISLYVLSKVIQTRAKASLIKGYSMGLLGSWVLVSTIYKVFFTTIPPKAEMMGIVAIIALIANLVSAFLLYKYRGGDSNRRSVWICSRNDAIANIAVILAGLGVWYTNTRWPDLAVAIIIASLALSGSFQIIRQAKGELKN